MYQSFFLYVQHYFLEKYFVENEKSRWDKGVVTVFTSSRINKIVDYRIDPPGRRMGGGLFRVAEQNDRFQEPPEDSITMSILDYDRKKIDATWAVNPRAMSARKKIRMAYKYVMPNK